LDILLSTIVFAANCCICCQVLQATNLQGLLEKLRDSNGLLDKINKGLNAYLEKKRLFFPRFVNRNKVFDSEKLFLDS